jgi:hypothetical protein
LDDSNEILCGFLSAYGTLGGFLKCSNSMELNGQIYRQRELIFQMDQQYQKQIDALNVTIARLEEQRRDSGQVSVARIDHGGSLSALLSLKRPAVRPHGQVPYPSFSVLPSLPPL